VPDDLAGRRVRELDSARKGTITHAAGGTKPGYMPPRAVCAVDFDDGTHAESLALGPHGKGDLVLVDETADPALYDTSAQGAMLRRYRALAGLRMYEGLAATLSGRTGA